VTELGLRQKVETLSAQLGLPRGENLALTVDKAVEALGVKNAEAMTLSDKVDECVRQVMGTAIGGMAAAAVAGVGPARQRAPSQRPQGPPAGMPPGGPFDGRTAAAMAGVGPARRGQSRRQAPSRGPGFGAPLDSWHSRGPF
jgi:hypothetical protein